MCNGLRFFSHAIFCGSDCFVWVWWLIPAPLTWNHHTNKMRHKQSERITQPPNHQTTKQRETTTIRHKPLHHLTHLILCTHALHIPTHCTHWVQRADAQCGGGLASVTEASGFHSRLEIFVSQQVTAAGGTVAFRTNHYQLTQIKDIYALLWVYTVCFNWKSHFPWIFPLKFVKFVQFVFKIK